MHLLYIANIRIPTERAHGIQIMKTCEALAKNGASVTLIVPNRRNNIYTDPFTHYNCERIFEIKFLSIFDFIFIPKFGFFITTLLFSVYLFIYNLFNSFDYFYSRDTWPLLFVMLNKKKIIYEAHDGVNGFAMKVLMNKISGIVTISNGLRLYYEKLGFNKPMLNAPDGVTIKDFILEGFDKNKCRLKFNLPINKKIVMYTGHLFKWKGVDTLALSSKRLPKDTIIVFVGGSGNSKKDFENKYSNYKNIIILKQQSHDMVPYLLKSADVVVLPNSASEDISRLYTSPMKLFEYMASGIPIVASNLPSICEILNSTNSVLVKADNVESLSSGINKILKNPTLANSISKQALSDVKKYDWNIRGASLVSFVKGL